MKRLDQLNVIANESTFERRRAEAMGFVFHKIEVVASPYGSGYLLGGNFRCVCGTEESFRFAIDEALLLSSQLPLELLDSAWHLRRAGSFSKQHLLADGYSPEAVDEIIRKGLEYRE